MAAATCRLCLFFIFALLSSIRIFIFIYLRFWHLLFTASLLSILPSNDNNSNNKYLPSCSSLPFWDEIGVATHIQHHARRNRQQQCQEAHVGLQSPPPSPSSPPCCDATLTLWKARMGRLAGRCPPHGKQSTRARHVYDVLIVAGVWHHTANS